jgi:hypothetical protein
MKRFLLAAMYLVVVPVEAAMTYNFETVTTGLRKGTLAGSVTVDGARLRMDIASGDDFLFKDNSRVLSNDGGRTLTVIDPVARTYYVMELEKLIGSTTAMMGGLNSMFKLAFSNPRLSVRDLGIGPSLAGYPTRRSLVDASYDVTVDAMGTRMTMSMAMKTESWSTDKLGADLANFLQIKNVRTGFPQLDRLIEAQSAAVKGLFPLKQVTTFRIRQGNSDLTSVSTSTVSNIQQKRVAPIVFAMPAKLIRIDDPITRMTKNLR